jgi:L-lactate utilization protein LutB
MPTEKWRKENIDKMRLYRRKWYYKNQKQEIKKETTEWLKKYKLTLSCEKCGESEPCCLDFHHLNPKEKETNIGGIAGKGWSKERIIKEIKKCKILCSNCHRKVHNNIIKL